MTGFGVLQRIRESQSFFTHFNAVHSVFMIIWPPHQLTRNRELMVLWLGLCDIVCLLVQTLGLSSASAGMFSNGAGDLVLHFITQCNSKLTEILAEQHKQIQLGQTECVLVHDKSHMPHNSFDKISITFHFLFTLHHSKYNYIEWQEKTWIFWNCFVIFSPLLSLSLDVIWLPRSRA